MAAYSAKIREGELKRRIAEDWFGAFATTRIIGNVDFERDAAELRRFIRVNFRRGRTHVSKLRINKNNFTHICCKWREAIYPFIDAPQEMFKRSYDRDF